MFSYVQFRILNKRKNHEGLFYSEVKAIGFCLKCQ